MGRVSSPNTVTAQTRGDLNGTDTSLLVSSGPADTGMQRLALSDEDKSVRDWFVQTMKDLKCQITVDEMGNIFAVRPGKRADVPATFIGSHLDTQPTGGRYDGILGVLAGVEALKRMDEMGLETEGGVGVVNWTKCGPNFFSCWTLTDMTTVKRELASPLAWYRPEYGPSASHSPKPTISKRCPPSHLSQRPHQPRRP